MDVSLGLRPIRSLEHICGVAAQRQCALLQIDSKKELEKLLKATCEVFIMAVTKLTVEPMLSFITKVTAVRVASSLNPGRRLREQVSLRAYHHCTCNKKGGLTERLNQDEAVCVSMRVGQCMCSAE